MVRHVKEGDQFVVYSEVYGQENRVVLNDVQVNNARNTYIDLKKEYVQCEESVKDMEAKKEDLEAEIAKIDDTILDVQEDMENLEESFSKFNGIFEEE